VRTLQVLAVRGERDWADVDYEDEELAYADVPTVRRLWGLPAAVPPSGPQHVRHHVALGMLICGVVDSKRMPAAGHHNLPVFRFSNQKEKVFIALRAMIVVEVKKSIGLRPMIVTT
jgi:hypothetical protein